VNSYDGRFERELKKRIGEERARLLGELEAGVAVTDYAKYQNYVGQLSALKRVAGEYCDDARTIIDKG